MVRHNHRHCNSIVYILTYQSAECGRFHRCRRLVTDITISEVGMSWSVAQKGIGDVGWLTKKILKRIGLKFQKYRALDVNSKNFRINCPTPDRLSEQPSRYGKFGSWLTRTFSGVFDLTLREFNFALAAHATSILLT